MLPRSFSLREETFRLLAREKNRRERGRRAGGDGAWAKTARGKEVCILFLLLFFFFFSSSSSSSLFLPQSTTDDRFLPQSTVDSRFLLLLTADDRFLPQSTADSRFWQYRSVAGNPRTGQLPNRYIPSGTRPYRLVKYISTPCSRNRKITRKFRQVCVAL
ncbi:hypothetical protein B296_00049863 [Ensete ventricosum]|uniref:Uncharacterized protein n=1 Tax=Ensete ventricosum TaxID=4639 RepID=A0A426YNX3_ENSVE|nr:hypothetical protein B296_00049863 [Ensete ventricosum]